MEAVREVVIGVLGSVLIAAEIGGRGWDGVLVEAADEGVGRLGEVFGLKEC